MRKKLEGNGLWESSRIILPELRERTNEYNANKDNRQRINLDDQELEQIGRKLTESLNRRILITVRLFDPKEQLQVVGMVDRISKQRGQFMINGDWYPLADIEGVDDVD
ncbi:YolD-like family protein [Paenibacillus paeoniae]|uniref:YolD-like family protein n=1 Tax=Paenibacillus paeoniae TaxID=2292705 RepID=A0A371P1C7_9BACL|nr:YolD-like family protein [Paenibacillus paeoniae]REK69360.1 YolD-like family protein [Paenibacillus paeoniae]